MKTGCRSYDPEDDVDDPKPYVPVEDRVVVKETGPGPAAITPMVARVLAIECPKCDTPAGHLCDHGPEMICVGRMQYADGLRPVHAVLPYLAPPLPDPPGPPDEIVAVVDQLERCLRYGQSDRQTIDEIAHMLGVPGRAP